MIYSVTSMQNVLPKDLFHIVADYATPQEEIDEMTSKAFQDELQGKPEAFPEEFSVIAKNVQKVWLKNCDVTAQQIISLVTRLPNLQMLDLERVTVDKPQDMIKHLCADPKELRKLVFACCPNESVIR